MHKLRLLPKKERSVTALVVLVASAILILACGESSNVNSGSAAGSTATGTTSASNSTTASANHFKVGNQVNVGNTWIVTVNSVATHAATDVDQPAQGDTYLVVDVSLKNTSSSEQDLSSDLQFSLQDATGQKYTQSIVTFSSNSPDGKVEPGSPIRGQMVYEVPTSQHNFTLAFEADITSSGQTIWDLSI